MGGREVTHAFNGMGTIVEVPNQPGDGEDVFRDDLVFPQGTLHLVTTNLGFAFNVTPRAAASSRRCSRRARSPAAPACSLGRPERGGVLAHGTAARAADGSRDVLAPTPHEVDRIGSTGTMSY
jgi:hypothetical protein